VWFILISSWVCSHFLFLVFLEGATLIGPSPISLEHWALPNRSTSLESWTPVHKIEANVLHYGLPFQFSYIGVELWANHMGQNWGAIGNVLGTWGTLWEPDWNTLGRALRPPPTKEKKTKNWPTDLWIWAQEKSSLSGENVGVWGLPRNLMVKSPT